MKFIRFLTVAAMLAALFCFRGLPCDRNSRFVTKLGFSDNGRWIAYIDSVIGLVTTPEGEFSR